MSAVVAAVSRELSEATRKWIVDATASLRDAGPDEQNALVGRFCGLGHALLRTGAGEEPQPLTRDGAVWLTADVRLDDRAALVAGLRASGEELGPSASDPELLIAAYHAWGELLLERIAGDFAFALWDARRRRLLCARDQLGVVPLHYARLDRELLVASSVEALLLHPEVGDELDEVAIADFLLKGSADFSDTAFRAIRRLSPAHSLTSTSGDLKVQRYWRQPEWQPLVRLRSADEYGSRFRALLEAAVADRIRTDRLSVQVSGGMDSTSVAAIACRIVSGEARAADVVRGFTGVLDAGSGDREGEHAELVARSLGIGREILDESQATPTDPFAGPRPVTAEPVPYQWNSLSYDLLRRPTEHGRVTLSGLGGDPMLGFVPWYAGEWLLRGHPLRLLGAYADQARLFRDRPHPHLRRTVAHAVGTLIRGKGSLPVWLAADFARRVEAAERVPAPCAIAGHRIDRRSLSQSPLWSTWFGWCDPSFSRLPIRLRYPFADLRLLAFVGRLPPQPWLVDKRILRDATRGLLPEQVRTRRKTPLVIAARTGAADGDVRRLAAFVDSVPAAERFVDRRALSRVITGASAPHRHLYDQRLGRALGLVYWLRHRSGATLSEEVHVHVAHMPEDRQETQ